MLAEGKERTIITVHSYKGGTGKTLIAANLATLLAAKGKKTCLLDMDLRAPSLNSLFHIRQGGYSFNDYLEGYRSAEQVLCDCRGEGSDEKNLSLCFADPSTRAIVEMSSKDRKWEMHALERLLSFGNTLFDKLFFDYLVIDTSPGLQYSSVNAIVAADVALVVTTLETSDMQGTRVMLRDLYKRFKKKVAVIVNKVPYDLLRSQRLEKVKEAVGPISLLFVEGIACSCEIPLSETPCFFACTEQNHPFSKTLERIVTQISHCQDRDFRLKPFLHILPLQKM
jgi:MinD-like ATPase involved in chromosome partitioning or flagellar assembly